MTLSYSKELADLFQNYIDWDLGYIEKRKFQKLLNQTSAENRFKLLDEVKGHRFDTRTGLYRAVRGNNVDTLKLMIQGWTTEQIFAMAKVKNYCGHTALHAGACSGSTAAVRYLLERLDQDQIFFLLKLKDLEGDTPLHDAVAEKRHEVAKLIASSVNLTNLRELLSMNNKRNKSVMESPIFASYSPLLELAKQEKQFMQRLQQQKQGNKEKQTPLDERIQQLETELANQKIQFMQRLQQQKHENDENKRVFYERIIRLEADNVEQQKSSAAQMGRLETDLKTQIGDLKLKTFLQEKNNKEKQTALGKRIQQLETELAKQEKRFMHRLQQQKQENDEKQRVSYEKIRRLVAENEEQQRASATQIRRLETEIQRLGQNFNRLEVYLRTPEVSDARGDQEIEDY